jgi:EAL domain-containing protein (putative c-di-GMP-specific phosphodiesterase class I)
MPAGLHLSVKAAAQQALGDSQFELLFQPKVSLIDGRTTGCEALIRWPHPERGTIHPGDFIPVVEPTSLMWPLTRWIVDTAVGQLAAWQREGRDLGVAVNLSAHDLGEPGFVDYVRETIARHGIPPDKLTFELTETAMYEDAEHAGAALHALHGLGVKLAIDDFGTGYSSLATLQAFRFDQIKIDKQFVEHLTRDAKSLEIAGAVAALGKALHCTVVAEGIEDGGIVAALRDLGCTEGQGYHFAKPMPVDAFNAWLRDNERIAV